LKGCKTNLVILVFSGLLIGCASTSIRSIHRSPRFRIDAIHHVLVIGIVKDQSLRKAFEEEFVRQWSAYGVKAVSSLDSLPSSTPLSKAAIEPVAKAEGYDTVLVTRILNKKKIDAGEPATPYVTHGSDDDIQNENTALQVLLAPPVYVSDYDLATIGTDLYSVASEKRVWSGMTQTAVMGKIPKLIPPFVKLILKRLYN
jgi:hypothetical protein